MKSVTLEKLLIACGGFLLGVLWMDLLFDTYIFRTAPASAVVTIASYYRHVTTVAAPLNRVIGGIMLVTIAAAVYQVIRRRDARRVAIVGLLLATVPIGLAALRIVPNAVDLGTQTASPTEQITLARTIAFDHLLCVVLVTAFVLLQIIGSRTRDQGLGTKSRRTPPLVQPRTVDRQPRTVPTSSLSRLASESV